MNPTVGTVCGVDESREQTAQPRDREQHRIVDGLGAGGLAGLGWDGMREAGGGAGTCATHNFSCSGSSARLFDMFTHDCHTHNT